MHAIRVLIISRACSTHRPQRLSSETHQGCSVSGTADSERMGASRRQSGCSLLKVRFPLRFSTRPQGHYRRRRHQQVDITGIFMYGAIIANRWREKNGFAPITLENVPATTPLRDAFDSTRDRTLANFPITTSLQAKERYLLHAVFGREARQPDGAVVGIVVGRSKRERSGRVHGISAGFQACYSGSSHASYRGRQPQSFRPASTN